MTNKLHQAERSLALLQAGGVANRMMATADGATMAMQQATPGMLAPSLAVRGATKIVAASNASAAMIAQSDYQCDGVADEVQINAALASLGSVGGTVLLSEGTFTLAAPIAYTAARQVLRGMGMGATTLIVVNSGGTPINTALVIMGYDYDELTDLTIDGNKANNGASTSTYGVLVQTSVSPLVERVRIINTMSYGLLALNTVANGVIRDCLTESTGNIGLVMRSVAGQPLVVSGCTVKSSGANGGFWCDDGPVVLSDCQSLSNTGYGFRVTPSGTPAVSFTNCMAQSNTNYGFSPAGSRAMLTNCRAVNNAGGFAIDGTLNMLIGCVSTANTAGENRGYRDAGTDTLMVGCTAADQSVGFYKALAGRASYIGCQAINNTDYGFQPNSGEVQIRDCTISGSSYGIYIIGGAFHAIDGCRISNIGGHGVYVDANAADVQITNNLISDVSTSLNASYSHVVVDGDRAFIYGNLFRSPAAGNRPTYPVRLGATSDGTLFARNDPLGAGTSGEYDSGSATNVRRPYRVALDYVMAGDSAAGIAANTWTDVIGDQSFTIFSPTSLVQFTVRGCILLGATTVSSGGQTRLVIDGTITPKIGGQMNESGAYYSNALAGGQAFNIQGLAAGTHTVRVQVHSNAAATYYLRAASFATQEALAIQVVEYAR